MTNHNVSVDGVYNEYVRLLETWNLFAEEKGSRGSMAKNFVKKKEISKLLGMLYTLKMVLTSLIALAKLFKPES